MKLKGVMLAVVLLVADGSLSAAPADLAAGQSTPRAGLELETNRSQYDQAAAKGPHHRRVLHTRQVDGATVTNSYVELANGMHYLDVQGVYQPTESKFELINGAAIARKGPHKVILAGNANTIGAVDMETPDGLRLRSHVVGLSLYDPVSGESELIAELKEVVGGELVAPNQIVYPDAFDGLKADLRYTYTQGGLEQDVILREQPDLTGWDPAVVRLEVLTEFDEAPVARLVPVMLRQEADPAKRQQMAEADFTDQKIEFGAMTIGPGRAFDLNPATTDPSVIDQGARVGKRFEFIDSRKILFESVELPDIQTLLEKLPAGPSRAAVGRPGNGKMMARSTPTRQQPAARAFAWLPARKVASVSNTNSALRLAQADYRARPGLVVDYSVVTSVANMTFRGDTTYHVTNEVNLTGMTVLEGGAVIKYDPWVSSPQNLTRLLVQGPFLCRTSAYRPAFFTAKDDNTVGEDITGSNGNPGTTWNYYWTAMRFEYQQNVLVEHVNVAHAQLGLFALGCTTPTRIRHSQFRHCYAATTAVNCELEVHNALYYNGGTPIRTESNAIFRGVNLTVAGAAFVPPSGFTNNATYLTNCLLIGVGTVNSYTGANNQVIYSSSGLFESAGGGALYLAANSPHRNAGTTNIDTRLLLDLRKKTTYPPVVLSNVTFTVDTVLSPQAQRDSDDLDLGYHYDPLDYLLSFVTLTNASLTLTNGVAVSTFGNIGILLGYNAKFTSHGAAENLNRLVYQNCVQEARGPSGLAAPTLLESNGDSSSGREVTLRFTEFSVAGNLGATHVSAPLFDAMALQMDDCQVRGGRLWLYNLATNLTVDLRNCLFERNYRVVGCVTFASHNSTYLGGELSIYDSSGQTYTFKDNLFDRPSISCVGGGTWVSDYNGYVTGSSTLHSTGAHDVTLAASPAFASSYLGNYYLPPGSALINAGSRDADDAGLYHHTTQINQTKDTNSVVDIGFHYVAVAPVNHFDTVWVEDAVPTGATPAASVDTWNWISSNPTQYSGTNAHLSANASGLHYHYFYNATATMPLHAGDNFIQYVYLDPSQPPSEVMLEFAPCSPTACWDHRPYWGTDSITNWAVRTYMGPLPATGGWVRLEVPTAMIDFTGLTATSAAYMLYNGRATFDLTGKTTPRYSLAPPVDTDSDGVPDYFEDANGNGSLDSWETDWASASDPGFRVNITRPRNNAILP